MKEQICCGTCGKTFDKYDRSSVVVYALTDQSVNATYDFESLCPACMRKVLDVLGVQHMEEKQKCEQ